MLIRQTKSQSDMSCEMKGYERIADNAILQLSRKLCSSDGPKFVRCGYIYQINRNFYGHKYLPTLLVCHVLARWPKVNQICHKDKSKLHSVIKEYKNIADSEIFQLSRKLCLSDEPKFVWFRYVYQMNRNSSAP